MPILVKRDDVRRGRKAKVRHGRLRYGRHRRQWDRYLVFFELMVCGQSGQSKWYTTQICRMLRTRHCAREYPDNMYLLDYKWYKPQ